MKRLADYFLGSQSPRAIAALVLGAIVLVGLLVLDNPRVNAVGGVGVSVSWLWMLHSGIVRPPDPLMTAGIVIVALAFMIGGGYTVATGDELPGREVLFAGGIVLVAAGLLRFRRRAGAGAIHAWVAGYFDSLTRVFVPPVPRD
ncbi:hypothetical protein OJ997_07055 [Solirubrobacter phytolaccae]|uniref:Uncharacterized protein n=1 Tax=Solirubrobacter phytolaccae TaxID=1404360 RepID=A0A9X3S7A1_9ACTN|nr:hypothetical protein [Solirubrobacter phytolaccae]MDA0180048.1 hypothetical protein [Solirubrobacter phytolaccae]